MNPFDSAGAAVEHGPAMSPPDSSRVQMRAMQLSLAVGVLMLFMKVYAWWITQSAAIFSDAAESVVHNVAVLLRAVQRVVPQRPCRPQPPVRTRQD
jgi:Co/Zn/Cd efflux system component